MLQELETPRALGWADIAKDSRQVLIRTKSRVRPGARLHLLAVGVGIHNEEHAKSLRLNYADRDARDLLTEIIDTQETLSSDVRSQVLLNDHANKAGIVRALEKLREDMAKGGDDDLVVHFSGHGALIDSKLYLLPSERRRSRIHRHQDKRAVDRPDSRMSCWRLPRSAGSSSSWMPATPGR